MSISWKQKNIQYRDQSTLHELIKQLLKVWSRKKVQDRYQNYFLIYLDTLARPDAEKAISKQIKLTLENNSYYFRIYRQMSLREATLSKIQLLLRQTTNERISDLKDFASLLNELRHNNYLVAEEVLSFNYECLVNGRHEMELIQGNNDIFQKLNADNQLIKQSPFSKHLTFSHSYDPFFLHHYQNIKKSSKQQDDSISQLFNLPISKAYKFMRAQQEILQFLSGRIPNKLIFGKPKRINYQLIEEEEEKDKPNKDQDFKFNLFKLENNIYMRNQVIDEEEENELRRSKTEQSTAMGYQYISPTNKLKHKYNLNKYRLPKIDTSNSKVYESQDFTNQSSNNNIRKFSDQDSMNKYTFKIRRMSLRANNYENTSSLFKKKNGYVSGLNRIKDQEQRFLNFSQKIHNMPKQKMIEDRQEDQEQEPLENKNRLDSPTIKIRASTVERPERETLNSTAMSRNFKLKAGNLKIGNVITFLKELSVKEKYRQTFEISNWQASIKNNQYYLHKFYINDQLEAVSLCCPLPEGNILIKYWAPLKTCHEEMSQFLFDKYLEHIEKNAICKTIFFNATQIPQIVKSGFKRQKQRVFRRQRTIPLQVDSFSYYPFLTVNFNIIAVPKTSSKPLLQQLIIQSNATAPFTEKEFICFNYLLIVNKVINFANGYSSFATYTPNMKSIKDVSTKLIKQQFHQNPYNVQAKISPINLTTIKIKNAIYSAYFIANRPYFKFIGEQIYQDQQSLIVSLKLMKNNTVLYFGKGFNSISSMMTVMKNKNSQNKKIEYSIRMFSKRMRGRILSINVRDEYCYGDFEVVFQWVDFLTGKIDHNLSEYEVFGGEDQNFYCIIEVQKENILGFQVTSKNFL